MAAQRGPWDYSRSTSQRRTLRTCGYKYLLGYGYGWRPRYLKGVYAFGNVFERLATMVAIGWVIDPLAAEAYFVQAWEALDQDACAWSKRAPWKFLLERGKGLARLLPVDMPQHFSPGSQYLVQETIRYQVGGVNEMAIPDFYGLVRKDAFSIYRRTVLDFKTSEKAYVQQSIELDEQLTDYQLAEGSLNRPVEQLGLCVMIYQEAPRIQWLFAGARPTAVIERFVHTVQGTDALIRGEHFYQNDRACFAMGTCEMVPICYPSAAVDRDTTLIKEEPRRTPEAIFQTDWE